MEQPVWTASVTHDRLFKEHNRFAEIDKTLSQYSEELAERGVLTIPSAVPLVIGRFAVFRTLSRLRAVDLRTGEPLWDFLEPDRQYKILGAAEYPTRARRLPVNLSSSEQDELRLFLLRRVFGHDVRHPQQRRSAHVYDPRDGIHRARRRFQAERSARYGSHAQPEHSGCCRSGDRTAAVGARRTAERPQP